MHIIDDDVTHLSGFDHFRIHDDWNGGTHPSSSAPGYNMYISFFKLYQRKSNICYYFKSGSSDYIFCYIQLLLPPVATWRENFRQLLYTNIGTNAIQQGTILD